MQEIMTRIGEGAIVLNEIHGEWVMLSLCKEDTRVVVDALTYNTEVRQSIHPGQAKAELVLEMMRQIQTDSSWKSQIVICDKRFGADADFRAGLHARGIRYMAEITGSVPIRLGNPKKGIPPVLASSRIDHADTDWGPPEHDGGKMYKYARQRIYTIARASKTLLYEWLL